MCVCVCVYVRMRECQWARINPNVFAVSLQILQVMICNNNVPKFDDMKRLFLRQS